MEFLQNNWGSIASVVGVAVSLLGFWAAVVAMKRAGKAREAAAAALEASQETHTAMTKTMAVVDLQRAIALVQRLKTLHRDDNWEASLEHYQPLRAMLADINGRHSLPTLEQHESLREAIPQITVIEDTIARALRDGKDPSQEGDFDETLNAIQMNLEQIASETYFSGSEAGG